MGGSPGAKKFEMLFNRFYGTNVKFNFTPGPAMTDMAGKITQEAAAGHPASSDVFVGTEQHFSDLIDRDVLEEYDYSALSPRIAKDVVTPRNQGVEFATIVSGITYNTKLVPQAQVPRKLEDLLDPKWKGKIASTTDAAIFDRVAYRPEWTPDTMKTYLTKLSQNVGGLIRASEDEPVISGEYAMLALDGGGHQVRKQVAQGAPLGHAIPEDAATLAFLHLGVPKNSAHPNLSKLFVNLVLSDEGQRLVFETHFTDLHELPGSQAAPEVDALLGKSVNFLRVDVAFNLKHPELGALRQDLVRILRQKSG